MVVPVGADDGKTEHVDEQVGELLVERRERGSARRLYSKAMIVMMTAITPSLKASSLSVSREPSHVSPRTAPRVCGAATSGRQMVEGSLRTGLKKSFSLFYAFTISIYLRCVKLVLVTVSSPVKPADGISGYNLARLEKLRSLRQEVFGVEDAATLLDQDTTRRPSLLGYLAGGAGWRGCGGACTRTGHSVLTAGRTLDRSLRGRRAGLQPLLHRRLRARARTGVSPTRVFAAVLVVTARPVRERHVKMRGTPYHLTVRRRRRCLGPPCCARGSGIVEGVRPFSDPRRRPGRSAPRRRRQDRWPGVRGRYLAGEYRDDGPPRRLRRPAQQWRPFQTARFRARTFRPRCARVRPGVSRSTQQRARLTRPVRQELGSHRSALAATGERHPRRSLPGGRLDNDRRQHSLAARKCPELDGGATALRARAEDNSGDLPGI